MITKTIGTGGDYADINLALNAFDEHNYGSFTDHVTFILISDITNSTPRTNYGDPAIHVRTYMNGKYFYINFNGFTCITSVSVSINIVCLDYIFLPTNGFLRIYGGTLKQISGGSFNTGNGRGLLKLAHGYWTDTNTQNIQIHDMKISNYDANAINRESLINGFGPESYSPYNVTCYNIAGYGTTDINSSFENCSIYGDIYNRSTVAKSYKNTFAKRFTGYKASPTYVTYSKCASQEVQGSAYAAEGDSVNDITDADFISVDPTNANFLVPNLNGDLYRLGTSAISAWNTKDINNRPRPNNLGYVNIGAHETIGANVTLIVTANGEESLPTTKTVIL